MADRLSVVERAFALARSGQLTKVSEIMRALNSEGYPNVRTHLDGQSIQRQLLAAMRASYAPGVATETKVNS